MLFNSIDFLIFLPIVFIAHWLIVKQGLKQQNSVLFIASYLFYGLWDWRFLILILSSTILDYCVGLKLNQIQAPNKRKLLLWLSITGNIGLLCYFKYANFFIESFINIFTLLGQPIKAQSLQIILPVGISFYTFQTLSYTIDVYRKRLLPHKDFIAFGTFVCFFPQLVAGPIERASHLLPQFHKKRSFKYDQAVIGLKQILWGLFKKMVIADNCATYANLIFNNSDAYNGSTLLLGAFFFTFQIYGDFSGYSDIAIGTARLFGIELKPNFNYPYFSKNLGEFWNKWHISLSTWFRDYVYIPLGGSYGSKFSTLKNISIVFLVSGLWHGANWTFVFWGLIHAILFSSQLIFKKNTYKETNLLLGLKILKTFTLVMLALITFRAKSLSHAINYYSGILTNNLFELPEFSGKLKAVQAVVYIVILLLIEWKHKQSEFPLITLGKQWNPFLRYTFYYVLILIILVFGGKQQEFIYFQF